MTSQRAPLPVSYFSMAVGVLALANAWRVAVRLWPLPAWSAVAVGAAGLALWLVLLGLYAHKWLRRRADAIAELQHPVQPSFLALVPVSSMLASTVLLPWSRSLAFGVLLLAVAGSLAVGAWLYGRFWQGGLKPELVTPAVYLPAVAQNFVAGTALAAFGQPEWGTWFFGAGMLLWLALESLIVSRLATHEALPEPLRPLLGIQLAPPVVGGVAWISLNHGVPDLFAQALLGYGLFQALLLLRLLPWIRRQPFAPSYWAFSFGIAALPTLAMRLVEGGATGPVRWLAPAAFVAANLLIGLLALKTLALLLRGAPAAVRPLRA